VTIGATTTLHLRCRSVSEALKARRPRPRYRPRIVAQTQLRYLRTSLIGRIPSWSPPVAPVGPFRPITVEEPTTIAVTSARTTARLEGTTGVLTCELQLAGAIPSVRLRAGDRELPFELAGTSARAVVRIADAPLWWPHTHGAQPLVPLTAILTDASGAQHEHALGHAGFRSIEAETRDGGFGLVVNGVPIFCRGAVWTPLDVVSLAGDERALTTALTAVRDAGMNLLRLSGTMVYETSAFYRLCDALGILVWQDFMFANLDYPVEDPAFAKSCEAEADTLLAALSLTPSLAVLCGNSEIEQQVAMLGLDLPPSPLFTTLLPGRCHALRPDVPYLPSSPTSPSGALPFAVDTGVTHYFGVGAYLRPLEDARRTDVRFAAECLAFANVPSQRTVDALTDGASAPTHPRWKARVPRDAGTGWDFEDVRDHYLALLFGVDPVKLRTVEPARYLALGRVVTSEVMAATFAEWRRAGSRCQGALLWFLRDLWPGAGWGVVESDGTKKAAYYFLRRALQPQTLLHTDEGCNGVVLHARNDAPSPLDATIEVALYRGALRLESHQVDVSVPARGVVALSTERILGRFHDTAFAYKFGPPTFELLCATLRARDGGVIGQIFHRPLGLPEGREVELGLTARAQLLPDGRFSLTLLAARFAYAIQLDLDAIAVEDDYFSLAPGQPRTVWVQPQKPGVLSGVVQPLNAATPTRIEVSRG